MWLVWFLAGMVFMFCIAAVIVHKLLVRVKAIVGTPSASHNSDYAAALRVYDEFRIDEGYKYWAEVHLFAEFCEQRLNAEKQHCA